jgi:hypothetical protein
MTPQITCSQNRSDQADWSQLIHARQQLETLIDDIFRRALDQAEFELASHLSLQDRIHLIISLLERQGHSTVREVLMKCSASLALSDALIAKLILNPSKISPRQIDASSTCLGKAASALRATPGLF